MKIRATSHWIGNFIEKFGPTLGTLILAYFALLQFQQINNTSNADFVHKLKGEFFTDKTIVILDLIDNDFVNYDKKNYYFKISSKINLDLRQSIIKAFGYDKKSISCYEMDILLLDHFEDLGLLVQQNQISFDMAYALFDWPIEVCWENKEIQKYIVQEKTEESSDSYSDFGSIYIKFHNYAKINKQYRKSSVL